MNEKNPLESQLRSWTPRRPSAELARRIFGRTAASPALVQWSDVWHWMTPVAAGVSALMLVVHGAGREFAQINPKGGETFYATLNYDGTTSNAQTVALRQSDENVEWNVWPHPMLIACSAVNQLTTIPTNR